MKVVDGLFEYRWNAYSFRCKDGGIEVKSSMAKEWRPYEPWLTPGAPPDEELRHKLDDLRCHPGPGLTCE